jgi:uncharacterized protein (TIGR02145 family)
VTVSVSFIDQAVLAQSPQGIPYQAVMRNADGSVMASSAVSLTFMIHDGTANGTVVYQESHALTSNAQGLVSCVVGNGVVSLGNFAQISWGNGAKFLHVMMGSVDLGTQQMLSVPYALYTSEVPSRVSETGDSLWVGDTFVIVPGISAVNFPVGVTSGLGSIVLPGNNTCANEYINVVGCNGQSSLTYDGRTYDLVEIGGQCWFADNLATDQYRNGAPIPTGLDNNAWSTTTNGAFAIYNNDPANGAAYGKLYNWYTTVDNRGLCPVGWHVPSDCEWMYLEGSLGMSIVGQESSGFRGTNEGGEMKDLTNWNLPNIGATNSSGFSALPGGVRGQNGPYNFIGGIGYWWTMSEKDAFDAWYRRLDFSVSSVGRGNTNKHNGFNVRCIKDAETSPVQGCTDGAACNFQANASQDDGSCLYLNATCNDNNANTINDVINGNCQCAGEVIVNGCTNSQACNYNPAANVDNGSCLIQGTACNDNNVGTINDVINANCQCAGTPSNTGATLLPGNSACTNEVISVTGCGGQTTLTYDGVTYDLVQIGGQCWFADNLATDQYRNGDLITTGLTNTNWANTTAGAYHIYANSSANDATYGKLYNWFAVTDTRGLCPIGWHIPSDCEWMYLENSLGMTVSDQILSDTWVRGTDQGGRLKSTTLWDAPNLGANNNTGFSALGGGYRWTNGTGGFLNSLGYWWTATAPTSSNAWYRVLGANYATMNRINGGKRAGFSVRCVKD